LLWTSSPVIFFNFVTSHHWLVSREGFSIMWQQVFRTRLNNLNTSLKNVNKLKSELNVTKKNSIFFFKIWRFSFSQNENIVTEYPCFICIFHILANFHTPIKKTLGYTAFPKLGSDQFFTQGVWPSTIKRSFCLLMNSIHWSQSQLYKLHPIPTQLL
jgi:hypothetical protein